MPFTLLASKGQILWRISGLISQLSKNNGKGSIKVFTHLWRKLEEVAVGRSCSAPVIILLSSFQHSADDGGAMMDFDDPLTFLVAMKSRIFWTFLSDVCCGPLWPFFHFHYFVSLSTSKTRCLFLFACAVALHIHVLGWPKRRILNWTKSNATVPVKFIGTMPLFCIVLLL